MTKFKQHYIMTAIAVVVLTCLQACGTLNPLTHAETLGQKGYASYGSFVVYEEQAAVLAQDANVPEAVKEGLRKADAVAKPVADNLLDSLLAVDRVRSDLAAGTTSNDKLVIATADLEKWYADAAPKIHDLILAVQGVRK